MRKAAQTHYEILLYISMRFASALSVLSQLVVRHPALQGSASLLSAWTSYTRSKTSRLSFWHSVVPAE